MIEIPTALVLSTQAMLREAHSALPHAPVVPERSHRPARTTRRTRIAASNVLHRAANAVAPAECSPAR